MPEKIFINYRRGDDAGFAHALRLLLNPTFNAQNVFMDIAGGIGPGDDWVKTLQTQVASCDVLLAVIGPRWLEYLLLRANDQKDYVVIEIEAALDNGKHIIPVLVNDAKMPTEASLQSLPDAIHHLTRRHAFELRPRQLDQDGQALIKEIKGLPNGGQPLAIRLRRLLDMHARAETTTNYADVAIILKISNPLLFRLLGKMADEDANNGRPLLCVLVVNKKTGIPGDKFFEDYMHLPKTATTEERRAAFERERDAVFSIYKNDKITLPEELP